MKNAAMADGLPPARVSEAAIRRWTSAVRSQRGSAKKASVRTDRRTPRRILHERARSSMGRALRRRVHARPGGPNLKGSFRGIRAAGRVIRAHRGGGIILVSSIPAQVVEPGEHPVDEQPVGRQLEGLSAMRASPERSPDAADGHVAQPRCASERVLQCVASGGVVSRVVMTTSSTWSSVTVRGAPGRGSSRRPSSRSRANSTCAIANGRQRQAQTSGHHLVVLPRCASEHDASPSRHLRSGAGLSSQRLELLPFGLGQNDENRWASRPGALNECDPHGLSRAPLISSNQDPPWRAVRRRT